MTRESLFHQYSVLPLTSIVAMAAIKCEFELVEHSTYSPDLAPSGYYFFSRILTLLCLAFHKRDAESDKDSLYCIKYRNFYKTWKLEKKKHNQTLGLVQRVNVEEATRHKWNKRSSEDVIVPKMLWTIPQGPETYNFIIKEGLCFLELSEEFCRDSKRVRISHGKRAVGVRDIKFRQYIPDTEESTPSTPLKQYSLRLWFPSPSSPLWQTYTL